MTEPTPSLRSALDAVRAHDRPVDVDREALLQKILSDVRPAPAPSHAISISLLITRKAAA